MVIDPHGTTQLGWTPKPAYAPDFFEQVPLQQFIGAVTPVPNGLIRLRVNQGTAAVYATTTDNRTNDSSIEFARRE